MSDTTWTRNSIDDMTGKVVVVTGANTGLGYETASELAGRGAHVVIASRNSDKAEAAQARITKTWPSSSTEVLVLDLADLSSVAEFAATLTAAHGRLDLLINNAGIMMVKQGRTVDGFEKQLGTNHLGHFALTGHLFDVLQETPGARVVTVSSLAHRSGTIDFDNLMYENGGYSPSRAYGRSKLANVLFALELQRRCDAADLGVLSVAAHPGVSATDLGNHLMTDFLLRPIKVFASLMLQDASAGAEPTLRAATDPGVVGGEYFGPAGMGEVRGRPILVTPTASARDPETAARLWNISQDLTGIHFLPN